MKKLNFLIIPVIFFSILLYSCSSASDEKGSGVEVVNTADTVSTAKTVDTTATVKIATVQKKVLTPEEEQVLLASIPKITDPEVAQKIYYANDDNSVEKAAFAKWEQLMLAKIASTNDLATLRQIYFDNDANKVEQAAYTKYKKLGGKD